MKMKTLKTCRVAIRRNLDTHVTEVLRHEVPILQAIHLPENVTPADGEAGTLSVEDSAPREFQRLLDKYPARHRAEVLSVFRNAAEVAQKTGLALDAHTAEGEFEDEELSPGGGKKGALAK